jgi:hypothetical protein
MEGSGKLKIRDAVLVVVFMPALASHVIRATPNPPLLPQQSRATQCVAPEYRQFDFWLGDWDVFDFDDPNTRVARVQVERMLDRCVLRESYTDNNGRQGQSLCTFDIGSKLWHQTWVTNGGQLLLLDGNLRGGEVVLSAVEHTADGKARHVRGRWKAVDGGVRETADTSPDGGKGWKPSFDPMFRPHKR